MINHNSCMRQTNDEYYLLGISDETWLLFNYCPFYIVIKSQKNIIFLFDK